MRWMARRTGRTIPFWSCFVLDPVFGPLDSVGEPFNTNYHEALTSLPSEDVEEGVVMNEVQRGWLLHGKPLRPAKVVVSKGKGA